MNASILGRGLLVPLAGALACGLAMFAGSLVSSAGESAALTVPAIAPSAINLTSAQAAESVLLPVYFRTIPLSAFGGNLTGLTIGVKLAAQTETGKQLIGTVVAISETNLTMRVESWGSAAPPSPRR